MKKYLGVKIIFAEEKTIEEAGEILKRPLESSEKNGYLVQYEIDGYKSWSPKETFEKSYREINNLTFGLAIEAIKMGKKVARAGWNGKGMWLNLQIVDEYSKMGHNYIYMSGADGKLFPWNPNNLDMLAEDWEIVE